MHWPEDLMFSLKHCQEDSLEHMFSRLKEPYRGTPTLKDLVVSGQLHHVRQRAKLAQSSAKPAVGVQSWDGLPRAQMLTLANQALDGACQFVSASLVKVPPSDLKAHLQDWWREEGEELLFRTHHDEADTADVGGIGEDDRDDDSDEEEVDGDPSQPPVDEDEQVKSVVEHAEQHLEASREIKQLTADLGAAGAGAAGVQTSLLSRFDSVAEPSELERLEDTEDMMQPVPKEPRERQEDSARKFMLRPGKTLVGLIEKAKLAPDIEGTLEEDSESMSWSRCQRLVPLMVHFMNQAGSCLIVCKARMRLDNFLRFLSFLYSVYSSVKWAFVRFVYDRD